MGFRAFALSALVLSAAPAVASDQPAAPAATATEASAAKPKKICRTPEAASGSRLGTSRVCKTAEEWAKADGKTNGRSVRSVKAD